MKRATTLLLCAILLGLALIPTAAQGDPPPGDAALRDRLAAWGVTPLEMPPPPDPALFALGEALFYDPILSGNQDIACATCHHPLLSTADALPLGLGTGTTGLGPERVHMPGRMFIPRHAPDLFNRGAAEWETMFWDGRVSLDADGALITPAGDALPPGLSGVLDAQALFPVTSPAEMRGMVGDVDVTGAENTLALLDTPDLDADYAAIWDALTARLLAIPAYADLFQAAYPDVETGELGFQHAANAIAAYESAAFAAPDSPFERYLRGDDLALAEDAKRGAWLFFGEAGCAACHNGPLLTDQGYHNMAVPQLGPGKEDEAPHDYGRGRESNQEADRYAFRTPSLHNVALTAPYMHDGAYATLDAALDHMLDPVGALLDYDAGQLPPELAANVWDDPATCAALLAGLDPLAAAPTLDEGDRADLLAFLHALTDPDTRDLAALVPADVPSGLPVSGP